MSARNPTVGMFIGWREIERRETAMSSNYQPGVNDDDSHFNLPDAGEDEADERESCPNCEVPLNAEDYQAGECTNCKEPL